MSTVEEAKRRIQTIPIERLPLGNGKYLARDIKVLIEPIEGGLFTKRIAVIKEDKNLGFVFDSATELGIVKVDSLKNMDEQVILWLPCSAIGEFGNLSAEKLLSTSTPMNEKLLETVEKICDAEEPHGRNNTILVADALALGRWFIERDPAKLSTQNPTEGLKEVGHGISL
jgi:hypothetical protein